MTGGRHVNRWHRGSRLVTFGLARNQVSYGGLRLANAKRFFGRVAEILLLCLVSLLSKARLGGLFNLGPNHLGFQGLGLLPQVLFLRNLGVERTDRH